MGERIWLFDTTLRDGQQTQGVDFSVSDKVAIARDLDALGIDYVEGGWPGANPTDDGFFAAPPTLPRAKLTAFGMTRRSGRSASNDPGLAVTLGAKVDTVCLVGKTHDYHATVALGVPLDENVAMIADSIGEIVRRGKEALFDAEHFFDGYKAKSGLRPRMYPRRLRCGGAVGRAVRHERRRIAGRSGTDRRKGDRGYSGRSAWHSHAQ